MLSMAKPGRALPFSSHPKRGGDVWLLSPMFTQQLKDAGTSGAMCVPLQIPLIVKGHDGVSGMSRSSIKPLYFSEGTFYTQERRALVGAMDWQQRTVLAWLKPWVRVSGQLAGMDKKN